MRLHLYLIAIVFLSGCATPRYVPIPGQDVRYSNGSAMTKSSKAKSLVYITPVSIYEGKARFALTIGNKSDISFTVYPNQITASNNRGRPVKIYTAQQMERAARTRANIMAISTAINAGGQSLQASLPDTTYYSGSVDMPYSQATYSGLSTTYSPSRAAGAQQRINDQADSSMSMISRNLSSSLEEARMVFDTTTVLPKQVCSGMLVTKCPKEIHFKVSAGEEVHTFSFVKSK